MVAIITGIGLIIIPFLKSNNASPINTIEKINRKVRFRVLKLILYFLFIFKKYMVEKNILKNAKIPTQKFDIRSIKSFLIIILTMFA